MKDKRARKIRFGPAEPAVEQPQPVEVEPASADVSTLGDRLYPMEQEAVQSEIDKLFSNWAAPVAPVAGVGLGLLAADFLDRFVETRGTSPKRRSKSKSRRRSRRRVA